MLMLTGLPLMDQYLSGSGIPSSSMQGMLRDWPVPVMMTGAPGAKRGGSAGRFHQDTEDKKMCNNLWRLPLFPEVCDRRAEEGIPRPVTLILASAWMLPNLLWASQV